MSKVTIEEVLSLHFTVKYLKIMSNLIFFEKLIAASYMALGKTKFALKDYETVFKARPNDKDAKLKFNECSKIVRQQAFERAIAVDTVKKSVSESINIDSMAVESTYSGPHLVNGKVTLEFMQELMDAYKDQKKLHRKYAFQVLNMILYYVHIKLFFFPRYY